MQNKMAVSAFIPIPFLHQINLRENRFFRAEGKLVGKKGTHNVKILTKKWTKFKLTS